MPDTPDPSPRRASDARFRRGREALAAELRRLLGARAAPAPVDDADRAAAIAAEARAAHRAAEAQGWAVVRRAWRDDEHAAVAATVHAVSTHVGPRAAWLVVPGREPQAVAVTSDAVLDNPLGFAALAEHELLLVDEVLPAGLWLARRPPRADATGGGWELEVWGTEPWLSAATRALREQGGGDRAAG